MISNRDGETRKVQGVEGLAKKSYGGVLRQDDQNPQNGKRSPLIWKDPGNVVRCLADLPQKFRW